MKIDLLRPLVPSEYKFRQDVLDMMFLIAKSNPKPTCHQDEIAKATNAKKEKIETVILYLVRNDYAKHVGQYYEPLYALTAKGQTASIDKEFLRTGRNETQKTVGLYLLIGTAVVSIVTFAASQLSSPIHDPVRETEEGLAPHQLQLEPIPEPLPLSVTDSVSYAKDSAMLRTAVNEKPDP